MENKVRILLLLAFILLLNFFANLVPSLYISFLILFFQVICLRKEDSAIVFMLMGSVFGSFYAQEGVRFIGTILIWGSALFILKDLVGYGNRWLSNFLSLALFLIVVLISIATTTGGNNSIDKFTTMLMNVIIYSIAFSHLSLFRDKHSMSNIGFMFVMYSIFLLGYMNELIGAKVSIESLLYSFAGFRYEINDYLGGDEEVWHVNYQDIGIHACIGLILTLFSSEIKENKLIRALVIFLVTLVVWYAAARQAILLYAIIILAYFSLYKGLSFRNIFIITILLLAGDVLLQNLDSQSIDFLMGSTEGKDSVRDNIINTAMSQFHTNPITGVGFGRFYIAGEYGCNEHNLFVELLAEMGIVGLVIFSFLCLKPLYESYNFIKMNKTEVSVFVLILLSYLLRSMVSSDLRETIVILILILCINMYRKNKTCVL